MMTKLQIRVLDLYIVKKFIGTYILSLALILSIVVVFDFSEKIDNFIDHNAPVKAVIFKYYLNFIPYFATLFSSLFTFITVIYFTSRMAYNSEIIAILSSGISYRRMLLPYFYSALLIALVAFTLTNFILPKASQIRSEFEDVYYRSKPRYSLKDIHRQVYPNVYAYMETYRTENQVGTNFTLERFNENGELESKLSSYLIKWDTAINKWSVRQYIIRDVIDGKEYIKKGRRIDTTLSITPDDFARRSAFVETMNYSLLNKQIDLLRLQGSDELKLLLNEKHRRISSPFSVFILTLIGVTLSSRKVRGGIGMQIGFGLALSFTYIFFMQFTTQFSLKGNLNPMFAMWLPNIFYLAIGIFLYFRAPK